MRGAGPALVIAAAQAAAGCAHAQLERAATAPECTFARESLALALQKDLPALVARMSPDLAKSATPQVLASMAAEIPAGAPSAPLLVGANFFSARTTRRADFTFEYAYPGSYLLGQAVVDSSAGTPSIVGMHLRRMPDSLERINAFRLTGRSWRHFAVLAAALVASGFTLFALVVCARTRGLPRKWLWLLFTAVGLGTVSLNWTTGDVRLRPVSFRLLSASATAAGPYAPWMVSFSLPVGAIVFLMTRRQRRVLAEDERLKELPSTFE